MGFFDDLETDVADLKTDDSIAPNTYDFVITKLSLYTFPEDHAKRAGQSSLMIDHTVLDDAEYGGEVFTLWQSIPNKALQTEVEFKRNAKYLKLALVERGVPVSRLADFNVEEDSESLIGVTGRATIKKSGDFTNMVNWKLTEESGVSNVEVAPDASSADVDDWA